MRTVTIDRENIAMSKMVINAIGYLSLWASHLYDSVRISVTSYGDAQSQFVPDLIAHYRNSTTGQEYTIGAVGDAKTNTYSFHS